MAAKVLTTGSTVKCTHQFGITFKSTATLTVGGNPVVRSSDVLGATIACTANPKCVSLASASTSKALHDGGSPVVLVTAISTDMASSSGTKSIGTCTVDAKHDLLQTD